VSRTFGQIQFELTSFAKSNQLPAVDLELVRGWINEAYGDVLDHRGWKGLEVRAVLQTVSTYRTGTVTVTNGSAAVTGSGTTFTTAMTGRQFRVPGSYESYTFTYVSGTSGTLDRNFEGETAAGIAFEIFQTVYQLPARVKHIALMRNPRTNHPMQLMTEENLDQASAARLTIGEPYFYSPATDTTDAATPIYHQVEIYPAPETAVGLNYTYVRLPIEFSGTNTSVEILPWVDSRAVIAGAKALMLAHMKQYQEAGAEGVIASRSIDRMSQVETATVGPSRLRMAPRYTRHRRTRGQWGA
jgi:hypothetical protein